MNRRPSLIEIIGHKEAEVRFSLWKCTFNADSLKFPTLEGEYESGVE